MRTMTIESSWRPLFFTGYNSPAGKFYAVTVVKVVDGTDTWFIPVFNWGAGRFAGWAGGQMQCGNIRKAGINGLSSEQAAKNYAITEAQRKYNAKQTKGYAEESGPVPTTGATVGGRLARKVMDTLAAHTPPATTPVVAPSPLGTPTNPVEFDGKDYEAAVATILTTTDIDEAVAKFSKLRTGFADYAADFNRAQAAMELAGDYIESRLRA